ncbi:MAG TPA: hypothetical protein VN522_05130 [Solirubrobacterales bacterium]|nr:hypothetical protein [Solirubrobacterales bacterium]
MATYTVTCRGKLGRGVITQLSNGGFYLHEEPEPGFERDGTARHFLKVEAGSADDAILVAKGAMAVAGGEARDYQATAGVDDEPE